MTEEKATWDDTEKQEPSTATKNSKPAQSVEAVAETAEPVVLALNESRPFGRMQNCPGVHYVQDGKLFGVDKRFVGTQQELIN